MSTFKPELWKRFQRSCVRSQTKVLKVRVIGISRINSTNGYVAQGGPYVREDSVTLTEFQQAAHSIKHGNRTGQQSSLNAEECITPTWLFRTQAI